MNEYFVGHETPDEEMAYGFIDTLDANFDDKISRTSNANADLEGS